MEETLESHDLSYGEWSTLCKLRRAPERTSTPGELSAQLELSSGAMTNRIDQLENAGFVQRHRDPTDRRGVRVEMTEAGDEVWRESTNTQAIKEKLVASALTKSEQHQLNGLLRKLMLEFERSERLAPVGRSGRRIGGQARYGARVKCSQPGKRVRSAVDEHAQRPRRPRSGRSPCRRLRPRTAASSS